MNKFNSTNKEPPCEQCFPKLDERNLWAWEIYQLMASIDSSGITADGILAFAQRLNAPDPIECLIKIRELINSIKNEEEKIKSDESRNDPREILNGRFR